MRRLRTLGGLLVAAVILTAVPVQSTKLVGYEDHVREEQVYRGLAHQDTGDTWSPTPCLQAPGHHELTLTVPAQRGEAGLEAHLRIEASHYTEDDEQVLLAAEATPGEPATLDVFGGCANGPVFTVEGLAVDAATTYTVTCTGDCYAGPVVTR